MKQYQPEERLVLLLSQPHPTPKHTDAAADILTHAGTSFDFEQLLKIANENQVALYVMENLEHIHQLSVPIQNKMKNWYLVNLKRNLVQLQQTLRVLAIFKNEGIDAIPLKGALGLELLQEDPGLYPLSDIDVLVRASDLEKAKDVLLKEGYQCTGDFEDEMKKEHYHICMAGDPYVVEVHWNLVKGDFAISPEFWWEDVFEVEYDGLRIMHLSWEKYLLYLIFRLYSNGFYPLKLFMLMLMIIESKGSPMDWNKLFSCAKQLKMRRLLLFMLTFVHDLYDVRIQTSQVHYSFYGYRYFRDKIIAGFFNKETRPYLSRIAYLFLLDYPAMVGRQLVKSVFPSASAIRLRYQIAHGSLKILPYYILNPFLMLLKKAKH